MAKFFDFNGDYTGLTEEKAASALELYGSNEFTETKDKSFKAHHILLCPVSILLAAAGLIQIFFLSGIASGIICILASAVQITAFGLLCSRCNKIIKRRMAAAQMKYRVIRNSALVLVPSSQLVPDDILVLQSGEMVPADAHILELISLTVDESRFTGVSSPAEKQCGADTKSTGIKKTMLYAGTRILSGSVAARICATGEDTYRARTAESKEALCDPNFSSYERLCEKLRTPICAGAAVICLIGIIISAVTGQNPAVTALTVVCALMCTLMPFAELFIRLYNTGCAKRAERKGAIIKNLGVLEKLNSLTCVIIDKSMVVAPNMLEVSSVYSKNKTLMTAVTVLSCDRENPSVTEQAFLLHAAIGGTDIAQLKSNEHIAFYPYNDTDRIGGNIYRFDDKLLLCVKGSVEKVTGLCDMSADKLFDTTKHADNLRKRGLEVWACAYCIIDGDELPKSLYSVKYTYIGMISFISATRDMIPLALQGCKRAGVRLVLTSCDNPETAASMGRKIGLDASRMITGEQLADIKYGNETADLTKTEIFSHITEAQRLEIIDLLRSQGETVAVVGNTDSDYEAVSRCDLGMTSLQNTTGCVYEACGLVVRDDNFSSVVEIIKEARQLHRNIKKCLSVLLTSFTAVALCAAADVLFSLHALCPLLIWLTAGVLTPLCCMAFRDNTSDLSSDMAPSGFIGKGKADRSFFVNAVVYGLLIGVISSLLCICVKGSVSDMQISSLLFISLCTAIPLTAVSASDSKSILHRKAKSTDGKGATTFILTLAAALLLTYLPFISTAFGFEAPHPIACILAVILGIIPFAGIEAKKLIK